MKSWFRFLVCILPGVLFFSYYPLISFGTGESMHFELSLPLIWLVVFAIVSFIIMIKQKKLHLVLEKFVWFLFPIFMTISLVWTHDLLRGVLIGGVLWLIYFAGFSFWVFRKDISDKEFWQKFFKVFFGTSLFVCFWCLLQSILDLVGVEQGYSLTCPGCTYRIFGFPHPNGFAAEPQFMGNLLLAPIVMAMYCLLKKKFFSRKFLISCLFIFIATLFLTMSRGAIYAFSVGMVFFIVWQIVQTKKWQILSVVVLSILAFLFTLNLQGIFAEVSKTDDTYVSGVSKVVNQLTLGVIDLGGSQVKKSEEVVEEIPVVETEDEKENETAVFDGYVEVSTDARTAVWRGALKTWAKDPMTILFGVGLGGSLKAMYESGNFYSQQEIINNQYINILLEGGIVGFLLLGLMVVLAFRIIWKMKDRGFIFTLIIMYMVSLVFFSELPNALHIYLLLPILKVCSGKN
ncbi:O-antigen ligase family protein [Candidatus Saccharibacteria bacterium]|nr:O-antigen ligase family protein [Candidatus Saccharibacteria bacterium]